MASGHAPSAWPAPDRHWTLFLDRDGVINERLPDDYVKEPSAFRFLPGVTQALSRLSQIFGRIIVVTNQQGIGKGLMDEDMLRSVHQVMLEGIVMAGGRVDAVIYCPHRADEGCPCRKPAIGMFERARELFPDIRAERSIMVGDSPSDMLFALNCGMGAVGVGANPGLFAHSRMMVADLHEFTDILSPPIPDPL
ncbi:MAG TPA: HAD family hydrolase [Bacteroidales bacterium]|nr:HAD family hydrolase [Bacteroidales bacterium]